MDKAARFAGLALAVGMLSLSCSSSTDAPSTSCASTSGSGGASSGGGSNVAGGAAGMASGGRDSGASGAPNAQGGAGTAGTTATEGGAWDMANGGLPDVSGAGGVEAGVAGASGSGEIVAVAREHDRYGAQAEAGGELVTPVADGNIVQMTRTMVLHQFTVSLHTPADQQALFFVFEAHNWNTGPLVPLWSALKTVAAGASREEPSPALSLQLEADKTYWIGVSLPGVQGSIEHGFHGATYFASSALVDSLGLSAIDSPPPLSISVFMPYKPSTESPVIETLELSLPD